MLILSFETVDKQTSLTSRKLRCKYIAHRMTMPPWLKYCEFIQIWIMYEIEDVLMVLYAACIEDVYFYWYDDNIEFSKEEYWPCMILSLFDKNVTVSGRTFLLLLNMRFSTHYNNNEKCIKSKLNINKSQRLKRSNMQKNNPLYNECFNNFCILHRVQHITTNCSLTVTCLVINTA